MMNKNSMYIDINLYINKYINGSLHKLSPCPLHVIYYFFFLNRKKQNAKESSGLKKNKNKKNYFICFTVLCLINILHLFKKRLTSASGPTELFSRSAEMLYNMYMYFWSYAYKYMSM